MPGTDSRMMWPAIWVRRATDASFRVSAPAGFDCCPDQTEACPCRTARDPSQICHRVAGPGQVPPMTHAAVVADLDALPQAPGLDFGDLPGERHWTSAESEAE